MPSREEQSEARDGHTAESVRRAVGGVQVPVRAEIAGVHLPIEAVLALGPGDVLVAPGTDPSWTPLFVPAAAVVVDVGAMLSHAVIVSRELGIPCVPSAVDASKRIPDGALVTVDGTAGTVTVIELPD